MDEYEVCPGCGESLMGGLIPGEHIEHYVPWEVSKAGQTEEWLKTNPWPRWKKKVGIEVRGVYDGILIWKHEDCGHMWPRFSKTDWERLHDKAVAIIREWDRQDYGV